MLCRVKAEPHRLGEPRFLAEETGHRFLHEFGGIAAITGGQFSQASFLLRGEMYFHVLNISGEERRRKAEFSLARP
jgi:hypothetical protein